MAYTVRRQELSESALLLLEADTPEELSALVLNATTKKGWCHYLDGATPQGKPAAWLVKQAQSTHGPDKVMVIGVETPYTNAAESICKALAIPSRRVMLRQDATRRVQSLAEQGLLTHGAPAITESTLCVGVLAPAAIEGVRLSYNLTDGWEALRHVLAWMVHGDRPWPPAWALHQQWNHDPIPNGLILKKGTINFRRDRCNHVVSPPDEIADVLKAHADELI